MAMRLIEYKKSGSMIMTLHWRHNDQDGDSNHYPHGCLLNRLFRRRSKKTSKLRVTGLCVENSPGPVNSPHKGPVTRKMCPFDDVIKHHYHSSSTTNEGSRFIVICLVTDRCRPYPTGATFTPWCVFVVIKSITCEYILSINP